MRGVWFLQAKQANMEYLGASGGKWYQMVAFGREDQQASVLSIRA